MIHINMIYDIWYISYIIYYTYDSDLQKAHVHLIIYMIYIICMIYIYYIYHIYIQIIHPDFRRPESSCKENLTRQWIKLWEWSLKCTGDLRKLEMPGAWNIAKESGRSQVELAQEGQKDCTWQWYGDGAPLELMSPRNLPLVLDIEAQASCSPFSVSVLL